MAELPGTVYLIGAPPARLTDHASYTVSVWRAPGPAGVEPGALLETLVDAARTTGAAPAVLTRVGGRPAVREIEEERPAHAQSGAGARRVSYTISSPADPQAWVVFTMVTTAGAPQQLADELVALFDAHLATLRWLAR